MQGIWAELASVRSWREGSANQDVHCIQEKNGRKTRGRRQEANGGEERGERAEVKERRRVISEVTL